jgi:hypothetical protein
MLREEGWDFCVYMCFKHAPVGGLNNVSGGKCSGREM